MNTDYNNFSQVPKRQKRIIWIVLGAALWVLQVISIIGNQGLALNLSGLHGLALVYGVGALLGSLIAGIIGTVFIIIGIYVAHKWRKEVDFIIFGGILVLTWITLEIRSLHAFFQLAAEYDWPISIGDYITFFLRPSRLIAGIIGIVLIVTGLILPKRAKKNSTNVDGSNLSLESQSTAQQEGELQAKQTKGKTLWLVLCIIFGVVAVPLFILAVIMSIVDPPDTNIIINFIVLIVFALPLGIPALFLRLYLKSKVKK